MKDLDKVLRDIDKNKSRNPDGLNKSIYPLITIGNDLNESLLVMFNKLRNQGAIPTFMKKVTVSTIPKTGSKFLMKN